MVVEGLKLMVLGMGVVGTFLAVLVVAISLSAKLLKGATERELAAQQTGKGAKQRRPTPAKAAPTAASAAAQAVQGDEEKRRLVAVMAAALAAHRAARQQ